MDPVITPHQERLLFIEEFERGNVYPGSPVYHNIPLILRGAKPYSVERLQTAVSMVFRHHAELHARFQSTPMGPQKRIVESRPNVVVELERTTGELSREAACDWAIRYSRREFRLNDESPVRVAILDYAQTEYLLIIAAHHLVADEHSMEILVRQIGEALSGKPDEAAETPEALKQELWQAGQPNPAHLAYWRQRLAGKLPPLNLPAMRPRPAVHTYTAARVEFVIPEETCGRVNAVAKQLGVPAQAVTLAAYAVLLARYAQQEDIVIGTSESRRHAGNEKVVGALANLVVIRSRVVLSDPFEVVVRHLASLQHEANANRDMPFDLLVRELDPEVDMSRTALFDFYFSDCDSHPAQLRTPDGQSWEVVRTHLGYGKYDLDLSLRAHVLGGRSAVLVYNLDFYDAWYADQLVRHFVNILHEGTTRPFTPVGDLRLLNATEEERELQEWNATQAQAPRQQTLDRLFSEQARLTPNQVAVTFGTEQVTYAELDARVNQLARHLRAQGATPDTLVAVLLDRSIEMVVGILAVLKSGAAYLPLDPAHPAERIGFIMADTQARIALTTGDLESALKGKPGVIIRVDCDGPEIAGHPSDVLESCSTANNLAYCIYTSGSTGKPKGMLIEHRQVTRLIINDRSTFKFGSGDVWTLFHSCCFDFSVWELFGALLHGGRLVIVPKEITSDPKEMVELAAREKVTVFNQTPTAFYHFARQALKQRIPLPGLRLVVFGGEGLSPLQLKEWKLGYTHVRLVNMYGITETTVHVTEHDVTDEDIRSNTSTIGLPIPTTTCYLFDRSLRIVPAGTTGEIYVGGEGVGRGYLNRPELTAERFVTNPYQPTERLYASGDLAYRRGDGRMIYVGRIDNQVQVRGFRVELGEVKTHLLHHPDIVDTEIIGTSLREGSGVELVAYVVTRNPVSVESMRRHLVRELPDYMVPSLFVNLPELPLTANGKVDRRALPAPEWAIEVSPDEYTAPRTPMESGLVEIWTSLLNAPVGIRDNFFVRGGHSILAAQFRSMVRERFGVGLPLRSVFETPTIEHLAPLIASLQADQLTSTS